MRSSRSASSAAPSTCVARPRAHDARPRPPRARRSSPTAARRARRRARRACRWSGCPRRARAPRSCSARRRNAATARAPTRRRAAPPGSQLRIIMGNDCSAAMTRCARSRRRAPAAACPARAPRPARRCDVRRGRVAVDLDRADRQLRRLTRRRAPASKRDLARQPRLLDLLDQLRREQLVAQPLVVLGRGTPPRRPRRRRAPAPCPTARRRIRTRAAARASRQRRAGGARGGA